MKTLTVRFQMFLIRIQLRTPSGPAVSIRFPFCLNSVDESKAFCTEEYFSVRMSMTREESLLVEQRGVEPLNPCLVQW